MSGCAIILGRLKLIRLIFKAQYAILDPVAPRQHDKTAAIAGIAPIFFRCGAHHVHPRVLMSDAPEGDGCAGRIETQDVRFRYPNQDGFAVAGVLTLIGTLIVALAYVGNDKESAGWKCFAAVAIGLVLAQGVSRLTEYYTSTHHAPVKEIAESAETGPATVVLSGTSHGLESSVYAVVAIAVAIGVSLALGNGNLQFSLYLVALTGMGMLATTGVIVSEDTFGPVSDNAAGIAEMSGEFHGEAQKIMVSLDAVGNTTKAVTKGFAIGSAVIAAVALFASYGETIIEQLGPRWNASQESFVINVADPKVFIGLLIGGSIAFIFSSLAIRAVSRTAGVVVQEVRRQIKFGVDWVKVHVTGLTPRQKVKGEVQVWSYDELRLVCDTAHELAIDYEFALGLLQKYDASRP